LLRIILLYIRGEFLGFVWIIEEYRAVTT
jgi:hypothetical protein